MTTADRKRWPGRAEIPMAQFVLMLKTTVKTTVKATATAIVILSLGCGSTLRAQQRLAEMMRLGDFHGAIVLVEDEKRGVYGGKNRLLYYLEIGMLLHIDGRYVEKGVFVTELLRLPPGRRFSKLRYAVSGLKDSSESHLRTEADPPKPAPQHPVVARLAEVPPGAAIASSQVCPWVPEYRILQTVPSIGIRGGSLFCLCSVWAGAQRMHFDL